MGGGKKQDKQPQLPRSHTAEGPKRAFGEQWQDDERHHREPHSGPQPDIVNSGGITGVKAIADLAAIYRTPITLHNVSGLLLNMATQQLAASIFNCPRIECTRRATSNRWATENPLKIAGGKMKISDAPGLGVDLDETVIEDVSTRSAGMPARAG